MKRSILTWSAGSALVALAAGTGCGGGDDEFANAIPGESAVKIQVPQQGKGGTSSESIERALVGQTSEFYQITYAVTTSVNLTALGILGTLHVIAHSTPSVRTADGREWGPWNGDGLDPLAYRARVKRIAQGRYTFGIDGRPRASKSDADWLALLDGMVDKGVQAGTGKGSMTLRFDNWRMLKADSCGQGTIAFLFDNTGPAASLDVMLDDFADSNPKNVTCKKETPHDASYHYDRLADGSGNFVFTNDESIHKPTENKPKIEQLSIRSRWTAGGAGRSDVRISGGEVVTDLMGAGLPDKAVTASQCWDTGFKTVFETSSPAKVVLMAGGDEKACAFTSAMLPQ